VKGFNSDLKGLSNSYIYFCNGPYGHEDSVIFERVDIKSLSNNSTNKGQCFVGHRYVIVQLWHKALSDLVREI
jgi:hypothetical protein